MVTVPSSGAQIFLSSTHSLVFTRETVLERLCGDDSVKKREYVDDRKIYAPLEGTVTIGNGQYAKGSAAINFSPTLAHHS